MSERNYYVICDDNCRFPAMTKEEVIAAIAEATGETPTDIDQAFITKIKEQNANKNLTFWVGTRAEYNALTTHTRGRLYVITDEDDQDELREAIVELQTDLALIKNHQNRVLFDKVDDGELTTGTVVEGISEYLAVRIKFRNTDLNEMVTAICSVVKTRDEHSEASSRFFKVNGTAYVDGIKTTAVRADIEYSILLEFTLEEKMSAIQFATKYIDLTSSGNIIKYDTHGEFEVSEIIGVV